MSNLTPLWLLKFLPNMLACHVTIVHDAQAPSNTITCGEASSHLAIGEAFRTISRGAADVCICGGAESKVNPMAMARPMICGQLCVDSNDKPEAGCRPFCTSATGTVAAEGGGLVILESLEHAKSRGACIYAELVGFGASSSVQDWARPDPDGAALALAMSKALSDADLSIDDIDLACPFATGIAQYDASEAASWDSLLGDRLNNIPAQTCRGAIGLNGAGSGAIDFAASVMALHRNMVTPSFNTEQSDQGGFRFVNNDPVDAKAHHALTTAYAMSGGQCAALAIRKYTE